MQKIVHRMITVLDPRLKGNLAYTKRDYMQVPAIDTHGTWPLIQMIDEDTMIRFAVLANQLPKKALKLLDN